MHVLGRFIAKVKTETNGAIVGDLEIVRIPLELYRGRNATSRQLRRAGTDDHTFARSPVFLVGDSAVGSPYSQSISLGFECAMFLVGLLALRDLPLTDMLIANLPLLVEQIGCPKRNHLDRIQNSELCGDLSVSIRQHRELEGAEGRVLLAPGEVSVVTISTRTEHTRAARARNSRSARLNSTSSVGHTNVKSGGQKKIAVHVPSSSCESTIRNSDPGSTETQACKETPGTARPGRAVVP